MITKNFKQIDDVEFLNDEKSQQDIFKQISILEDNAKKDCGFLGFGNEARNIAETIIFEAFEYEGMINDQISLLKENHRIPTNVWNAILFIRNNGNSQSHGIATKSAKLFNTKFTQSDAIIFLRSIWILLKFVLQVKELDINNLNFDSKIYKEEENLVQLRTKEIDNDNNDINTHNLTISQLTMLGNYVFNIPTYQRDYTWESDNIEKLIEDIESRTLDNKTHYLGALALAQDKEKKILRIIDGQQRITTTLILLKTFYDEFKKRKLVIPKELEKLVINKLKNIYVNQKVLLSQKAVENVLQNNFFTNEMSLKKSNAFVNYDIFSLWLAEKTELKLIDIYSTFASKFEVATLFFNTTVDNEMDIFENLNTTGTKLSNWEVIKNFMFSRLDPKLFINKELELNKYINNSFAIPLNAETTQKISSKLTTFFTIYNRLQFLRKENFVWKNRKVYDGFKKIWQKNKTKFNDYEVYMNELNKIKKIFNIYREVSGGYKSSVSPLHKYNHILSFIFKDDIAPLLIYSLEKNAIFDENDNIQKINGDSFYNLIRTIENYAIRLSVVSGFGNSQAKDYDKFLQLNAKNNNYVELGEYFKTQMQPKIPTTEEFVGTLSRAGNLKHSTMSNILINIERKIRGTNINSSNLAPFEKTHEQIIAKNLSYLNYDEEITEEEFQENQDRWSNAIGNALILPLGENSKVRNKKFIDKIVIYNFSNSNLAKGNNKIMNLTSKKMFTFEDIKKRSKQMAEYIAEYYSKI